MDYDPLQGSFDLARSLPILQNVANDMTKANTKQREKILPGSQAIFSRAGNILQSYMRGEIPQDAAAQINRQVAEQSGSFNPNAPGMTTTTANFARNIGKTSLDLMNMGLTAAPTWQQLAQSFVTTAQDTFAMANQMAANRYQYDALNNDINQFNATGQRLNSENVYSGQLNAYEIGQQNAAMQAKAQADQINAYGQLAQQGIGLYDSYRSRASATNAPTAANNYGGWQANATAVGGSGPSAAKSYPVPGGSAYTGGRY